MELKVWRDGDPDPLASGLATGWLVIFDQRSGLPPIHQRTTTERATTPGGRDVSVIRA